MASAPLANSPLRADMSNILVLEPMIASTALFMKHQEVDKDKPGHVAATDGERVLIWPAFHRKRKEERAAILLHEYLHVAFAHPLRAMKLKMRLGSAFRMDILNVAGDAIINEGITNGRKTNKLELPDDGVKLQKLAEQARAIVEMTGVKVDHERMKTVGKLTLEWLYDALVRLEEAARNECSRVASQREQDEEGPSPEEASGKETGEGRSGANDNTSQSDPRMQKAREFLEQFQREKDLEISSIPGMSASDLDDRIRAAGEKLRNSIALGKGHGQGRGSIVENLIADIPHVNTPWEASFRSITQRHLARTRERRPTKPGRRVLTQEAMNTARIVWAAGRRRPPVPRVLVVLDSSGSIRAEEYIRYLSEIQAMKRRTNAQVFAAVADASIQSVQEIKDARDLARVEFKGRGGTDFRPAFELADEMDVDLVVYLTDLMGTFPQDKPQYPVLWTLPGREIPSGYEPPFGRVLLLD